MARDGASIGPMQTGRKDVVDESAGSFRPESQLRMLRTSVEKRPEHQPESLRVSHRKQDVGNAHGVALAAGISPFPLCSCEHLTAEPLEAVLGNGGEQGLLVGEVVIGRGIGDAGAQRRAP